MSREKHHSTGMHDGTQPEDATAKGASSPLDGNHSPGPGMPSPSEGAQLAEAQQKLLRALADAENLRRQARREQEDARRFAISEFARDLLATADALELALANVPEAQRTDPALAPLIGGVEATRRMLLAAFSKHGVSRSDPLGEAFDPHVHEAGFRAPGTGAGHDTVTEVVRPGYALHGRVLRPALVGVATRSPDAAQDTREARPGEGKTRVDNE